jgi:hypothetical protein
MLTPLAVKAVRPAVERREIPDAGCKGLYLVVQPAGAKSWAFRYRFNGRPKKLTLGPLYLGRDELEQAVLDQPNTLAGARKLAGEAALQVARGIDPAKHKKREKKLLAAARIRAFLAEGDSGWSAKLSTVAAKAAPLHSTASRTKRCKAQKRRSRLTAMMAEKVPSWPFAGRRYWVDRHCG